MADDPDTARTGPTDRHADDRDRRRRPRMPVSGRSLQHVVNAIARRGAAAKQARATKPDTADTADTAADPTAPHGTGTAIPGLRNRRG